MAFSHSPLTPLIPTQTDKCGFPDFKSEMWSPSISEMQKEQLKSTSEGQYCKVSV